MGAELCGLLLQYSFKREKLEACRHPTTAWWKVLLWLMGHRETAMPRPFPLLLQLPYQEPPGLLRLQLPQVCIFPAEQKNQRLDRMGLKTST